LFLCTWAALHPNVPNNSWEPRWRHLLKRIFWMATALLAPELVLVKAGKQWITSCNDLKEKLERDPTCRWTETHAMLARMGGIRVVNADGTKGPRTKCSLCELPDDIEMPTKEEIQDRSKKDYVAKAITIIQTMWFAIQAAHRVSQGLIVTELEVTTLAHVVLNILIYWCWWNKPLNIRFPIDVYPRRKEGKDGAPSENKGGEKSQVNTEIRDTEAAQITTTRSLPVRIRVGAHFHRYSWYPITHPLLETVTTAVILSVIGAIFGAIHFLAWNSTFPTPHELYLWHMSAIIVTAAPCTIVSVVLVARLVDPEDNANTTWGMFMFFSVAAYCFARICLLTLALIALRTLPYRAYEVPSWSGYVPNIG